MSELQDYTLDKEAYFLLLMLYCANVNNEETEEELKAIKSGHSTEKFEEINSIYESLSDYELLQILINHRHEYILSKKDKDNLMRVAKAISEADQKSDAMEKEVLHMLNILLNNQN